MRGVTEYLDDSKTMPEPTVALIRRIRDGDGGARDVLLKRYLPVLRRWAHGRLPASARDLSDTDDLVQVTLLRALKNIDEFDARHTGSFLAYLRQILLNHVRDELRRQQRRPGGAELDTELAGVEDGRVVPDCLKASMNAKARSLQRRSPDEAKRNPGSVSERAIRRRFFGSSYKAQLVPAVENFIVFERAEIAGIA